MTFGIYSFPRQNTGDGFVLSNTLGVGYNRREHANLKLFKTRWKRPSLQAQQLPRPKRKGYRNTSDEKSIYQFQAIIPADPRPRPPEYLEKRSVNAVADATGTTTGTNNRICTDLISKVKWSDRCGFYPLSLPVCRPERTLDR